MPRNPSRRWQGGDVEGSTRIDVTMGEAIPVASASFEPGYDLETTLSDAGTDFKPADLLAGYCGYGKVVGESK